MVCRRACGARFSERKGTALSRATLKEEKAVAVLERIRERAGTRAGSGATFEPKKLYGRVPGTA